MPQLLDVLVGNAVESEPVGDIVDVAQGPRKTVDEGAVEVEDDEGEGHLHPKRIGTRIECGTICRWAATHRDHIEQPWLGDLIPFQSMSGKRVLEIGFGPGYDALKFMQAGADYSGIDITAENVERTKKHLGY